MNPSRASLNLIAVLAIATASLLLVQQRRAAAPIQPVQVAQLADSNDPESLGAPVESKSVTRPVAAPQTAQAIPPSPAPTALQDGTPSPELNDDVELAYQLGEDVTTMSPEAKAQLRADWQAHLSEASQAQ